MIARPRAQDYARTLSRCDSLVAVWSASDDTEIAVTSREPNGFKRVRIKSGLVVSNVAAISRTAIADLVHAHGRPELASYDDYQRHFLDGDSA